MHVFRCWIQVQVALEIAVNQRFETHRHSFTVQRGQRPGLVTFGFGQITEGAEVGACGDLQLCIHGEGGKAGVECAGDDLRTKDRVAGCLNDQLTVIDQIVDRVGINIRGGQVSQVSPGEHAGYLHVRLVVNCHSEPARDKTGSDYSYARSIVFQCDCLR